MENTVKKPALVMSNKTKNTNLPSEDFYDFYSLINICFKTDEEDFCHSCRCFVNVLEVVISQNKIHCTRTLQARNIESVEKQSINIPVVFKNNIYLTYRWVLA